MTDTIAITGEIDYSWIDLFAHVLAWTFIFLFFHRFIDLFIYSFIQDWLKAERNT